MLRQVLDDHMATFGTDADWFAHTGDESAPNTTIASAYLDQDYQGEDWVAWIEDPHLFTDRGKIRVSLEPPKELSLEATQAIVGGSKAVYCYPEVAINPGDILRTGFPDETRHFRVTQVTAHARLYTELLCRVGH